MVELRVHQDYPHKLGPVGSREQVRPTVRGRYLHHSGVSRQRRVLQLAPLQPAHEVTALAHHRGRVARAARRLCRAAQGKEVRPVGHHVTLGEEKDLVRDDAQGIDGGVRRKHLFASPVPVDLAVSHGRMIPCQIRNGPGEERSAVMAVRLPGDLRRHQHPVLCRCHALLARSTVQPRFDIAEDDRSSHAISPHEVIVHYGPLGRIHHHEHPVVAT